MDNSAKIASFVVFGMIGYTIFIALIFQTDSPQFWKWWTGEEDTHNPSSYSHFKSVKYDKSTNNVSFKIYNGNNFELMFIKDQCSEFIKSYEYDISELNSKLSTFSVSFGCSMVDKIFADHHEIVESIIIPFGVTSPKIAIQSPFQCNVNRCQCNMILYSNFLAKNEKNCFISFKHPVISMMINT